MSYLKLTGIDKYFGDHHVLKNIDLEIDAGEFICFLGPSGCGKTTLLRAIAGLERQSSGVIMQNGEDISNLPAKKRDFGIVFQSYALFPNLTIADNVAYGLKATAWQNQITKVSNRDIYKQVDKLLSLVGLQEHSNKYPNEISGGQQQRVALARAIALKPGLLLLDEPLSALDAKVRAHLRSEIKKLQENLGVTTIMVTHDQEEALAMADRIVVMNAGVIEQIGTPQEVYLNPASEFVADFVGDINILKGPEVTKLGLDKITLRPEHISVSSEPVSEGYSAKVESLEFLGSKIRLALMAEGFDSPITVDVGFAVASDMNLSTSSNVYFSFSSATTKAYAGALSC